MCAVWPGTLLGRGRVLLLVLQRSIAILSVLVAFLLILQDSRIPPTSTYSVSTFTPTSPQTRGSVLRHDRALGTGG